MWKFLGFDEGKEQVFREPQEILADASAKLENNDYEAALKFFDELCSLPVQSALPFLSRATCHLQLKNFEKAITDCKQVLQFLNTDIDAKIAEGCTTLHSAALLRMSSAHKELGQMEEAKSALIRKDAIEAKKGMKSVKSGSKNENDSDDFLMQNTGDSKKAEALRLEGNELYRKAEYKQALEKYRMGLGIDIYSEKLHSNSCLCLIQLGDLDMAQKHALQVTSLNDKWAKGPYLLGKIAMIRENYNEAESQFNKSLLLDKNNITAKNALAELNMKKKSSTESNSSNIRNRKNPKNPNSKSADKKVSFNESSSTGSSNISQSTDQHSDESYFGISKADIKNGSLEIFASLIGIGLTWLATKNFK
ncbi:Sperm-associated antigen 1 [Smittium culicis]|uniref:Sperm-associated antigen 1 n=2 Tax=Smittium culicis TaxID=133412 RepID=A0A1R1YBH5_9FUNG|nr:Sperm-associated antigen 1 [Smittium culicis]